MEGPHYRGSGTSTSTATTPMRPGTPNSRSNPFGDDITPAPGSANPFASPANSRPASSFGSSSAIRTPGPRYFHSRRVRKGDIEKPWLEKKNPREKWVTIIPLIGLALGLGLAGFLVYDGLSSVVHHKYCPVLMEDFSNGLDSSIWTKEVQCGGFGNGEFEETTNTDENIFIENGNLVIKPTLQDAALIEQQGVLNLTKDGTCTSTSLHDCVSVTNFTSGTIINPVKSGRINTKAGASIKYGRVEVEAIMPVGDWLWPAIWMLPVNDTYGGWPRSGEIDIAESRGNNHTYHQGGNNIMSSALHWGPNSANDGFWRTNNKRQALHSTYSDKFHTFGLEWSEKYLYTYVDSLLLQVMYTSFSTPLWNRGNFPASDTNGTRIDDIWAYTGHDQAPFDQPFFLILNVAVGSTNGWFQDAPGKPWFDNSPTAASDFWNARNEWYPTWSGSPNAGQMTVKSVKLWQQCDGGELN
ncbi:hypothetical protein B7463_g5181, partial [Scytalidium lignicola]